MMNARELRDKRTTVLDSARTLVELAEKEDRDLTQDEQKSYDDAVAEAQALEARATRLESLPQQTPAPQVRGQAPAFNRTKAGETEERAIAHYVKTGDVGAVRSLMTVDQEDRSGNGRPEITIKIPSLREMRAVTNSSMNITTAGDGGNAVPTGFVNQIAARRSEIRLADRLGVRRVPGVGTTVNYPFENADAQEFTTTAEQSDAHDVPYTRDAAQLGSKAFTLVKKTKKIELTEELLDDEDANLMDFVADNIGRGIALTHNGMLVAEVGATGTALKTFASQTAIAAGEPDAMVYHDTLANYLDDGGSNHWVMKPSTFGAIKGLSGDARIYGIATTEGRNLLEYPVHYSSKAGSMAADAKSVLFGNWYYMGMREDPVLRLIRDIYSVDGMVILKYSFRAVYGQLIAGAIGYGKQAAAG
jgi:HK97 family phage major capsid protein